MLEEAAFRAPGINRCILRQRITPMDVPHRDAAVVSHCIALRARIDR
jgi:hypothetical protein